MELKRKSYGIMVKVKELEGRRCILELAKTTLGKATSLKTDTSILYKVIIHSYLGSSWKKLGLRTAICLC